MVSDIPLDGIYSLLIYRSSTKSSYLRVKDKLELCISQRLDSLSCTRHKWKGRYALSTRVWKDLAA